MYSPQYGNVQARMAELVTEREQDHARRISEACKRAQEFHRRGDVVLRNQMEETIRELCTTRIQADILIAGLYGAAAQGRP